MMRRIVINREVDVSGTSGTGFVVEGVQLTDDSEGGGKVVIRWKEALTHKPASIEIWDSIKAADTIHGHGGSTKMYWLDDEQGNQLAEPVEIEVADAEA